MDSSKQQNRSTAVLGAGISGLTTAYLLTKEGWDVTVYEKNETTGGAIHTNQIGDWRIESGPNTLMIKDDTIWNFFDDLALTNRVVEANPHAQKRFIVRDHTLQPVPTSIGDFLTTPLFSTKAKLRLLKEPFIPSGNEKDESISQFIQRRLGAEPLNYAVNPFVAGVYAGDSARLSIKHTFSSLFKMEQAHGSITKGMMKRKRSSASRKALISFDNGTQTLTDRLQQKLQEEVLLHTTVTSLSKKGPQWQVEIDQQGRQSTRNYSTIVSTLPAHQLAKVWDCDQSTEAINRLTQIEYAPIHILALGFKQDQINHPLDGFGFLVPKKEKLNLLGCLFSSSLFAQRAPKNHALLTCFIGGARQPALAEKPTEELIDLALNDLDKLLGIETDPVFEHSLFHHRAIPQFKVGYDAVLDVKNTIEKENTGFFISGNYISGVSVPDCICSAFELVDKIK